MRQPITEPIQYFSRLELACKGSGLLVLDPFFAEALPLLRMAWGEVLNPSSVCRSPEHNKNERGNPNSLHLTKNPKWPTVGCMAADIRWAAWPKTKKFAFARLAWRLGWSVGLHAAFCHVDRRADLSLAQLPQTVFLYDSWNGDFSAKDVK